MKINGFFSITLSEWNKRMFQKGALLSSNVSERKAASSVL